MNIVTHIKKLKKDGITILKNILSAKECERYVKKSNKIIEKYLKKKQTKTFNNKCLWVPSPFRHDESFYKLIFNRRVDKILTKLIDKDYVLTNMSIINRKITKHKLINGINMGELWHTDSRYVSGKRLEKGFGYIVIIMFEDFTKNNGCTQYIPRSHFNPQKPKRTKKYKHKLLTGKKGSVVIMDTGLWHRGGEPSEKSRWSLYSYYSPWFVKPYYDYVKMLGEQKLKKMNKNVRKLLHCNSTPPINDDKRTQTLTAR
jgi:ectoine hydroxylase-related dioxygenase (phytanoyl-CoA dioxygenase family)